MTKLELDSLVAELNEHLSMAVPGSGPSSMRQRHREEANKILLSLPKNWWRKANPALVETFQYFGGM